MIKHEKEQFCGSMNLGSKGQAVIPVKARKALKLEDGASLLVFTMGDTMVCTKLSNMKKLASHLAGKLSKIQSVINKSK